MILDKIGRKEEMDVNRKLIKRLNSSEDNDDGFVDAEKSQLLSMMWDITRDAWSFIKGKDAERRLQRDVAAFIRRAG